MHQPINDYWVKHYLIEGKGCCLCGNIGILDTTGVRTIQGEMIGRQTFCLCPNGQHLRQQIQDIKSGENRETQTRIEKSEGNIQEHQPPRLPVARPTRTAGVMDRNPLFPAQGLGTEMGRNYPNRGRCDNKGLI